MDIEKDLKIDKFNLDEEWGRQAMLVEQYTESLATSLKALDELKLILDRVISEKKQEIRKAGIVFIEGKGIKPTENGLNEMMELEPTVQEYKKKVVDKEYEVNCLKGVVEALRNKKSALEYICQLQKDVLYAVK